MSDRSKPQADCPRCGMNRFLCICSHFSSAFALVTRVSVIIPWLEWIRTSNTGRLVGLLLENSHISIRGKKGEPMVSSGPLADGYENFVLYPGGTSLSAGFAASRTGPINLIVPDGTWESACRTIVREKALAGLPRVSLPPAEPSAYRLRSSTVAERLATVEAVGRALEVLEGPQVREQLEKALRMKVDRMLWAKGRLREEDVAGGIPESAKRWKTGAELDFHSRGRIEYRYGN